MSRAAAGNYYIINRCLSPTGDKLAATFNGQEFLTLTPLANLATQKCTIVDYGDGRTQSVSPMGNLGIQAGGRGAFIAGIRAGSGDFVFLIRGGNGAPYTIHTDDGGTANWAVDDTKTGSKIACGGAPAKYNEWILQPV